MDDAKCECEARMEGECLCGAWRGALRTADDETRGDLREALQTLAASNARLCGIAMAADDLVATLERYMSARASIYHVEAALSAYKAARRGQ